MTNDPTPAAAEARAKKATERDTVTIPTKAVRDVLTEYQAVLSLPSQWALKALHVAYEAALALPPPEAKDGAAPSPETAGVSLGYRYELAHAVTDGGDGADWRWHLDPTPPSAGKFQRNITPLYAAAPAAPSPDLAALEELAGRLERYAYTGEVAGWDDDEVSALRADLPLAAKAIRTTILHLKAQPK